MIDARFVPIEKWPCAPTKYHKHAHFRSSYAKTLDLLEDELSKLRAKHIVIEAYFLRSQIRNDGWPLSKEVPSQPGVIVSFTGKDGELSFPCDRYSNWQDNLRAIALGLEALRAVDRYGVTQHAEQYKGWSKLPPAPDSMRPTDGLAFLKLYSDIEPRDSETLDKAYRAAARKLHPDNPNTGNSGQFVMLQQAKEAVQQAYGW